MVHQIVDDHLAQTSHDTLQGRELTTKIIRYLVDDDAWVDLYRATGELVIPSTLEIQEDLKDLFTALQQVT